MTDPDDGAKAVVERLRQVFPDKSDAELAEWLRQAARYLGVPLEEED